MTLLNPGTTDFHVDAVRADDGFCCAMLSEDDEPYNIRRCTDVLVRGRGFGNPVPKPARSLQRAYGVCRWGSG
jgi:hypothetical protein